MYFDRIDGVLIRSTILSVDGAAGPTAMYKCPGVRPIGVGDVLHRIIVSSTIKYDLQDAVGPLQLCAGFEGDCVAAVYAMEQVFYAPTVDAVIQVDASNEFNSLNRQTATQTISVQQLPKSLSIRTGPIQTYT